MWNIQNNVKNIKANTCPLSLSSCLWASTSKAPFASRTYGIFHGIEDGKVNCFSRYCLQYNQVQEPTTKQSWADHYQGSSTYIAVLLLVQPIPWNFPLVHMMSQQRSTKSLSTVKRIWYQYKDSASKNKNGVGDVGNKRKQSCGRKRKATVFDSLEEMKKVDFQRNRRNLKQ